jgi:hypothetical protein
VQAFGCVAENVLPDPGGGAGRRAEPLIAALRTPAVQSSIDALGGYDLSRAGSAEMLAWAVAPPAGSLSAACESS